MEETAPTQEIQLAPIEENQIVEEQPTRSVKTFWERLDEVFELTKGSEESRKRFEELLEQFPDRVNTLSSYKSFIFQPERVSLSSNDDRTNPQASTDNSLYTGGHIQSEKFSRFRIKLNKPLLNVKSIQLLSAVIPNAVQNIPDEQVCFFWYKLRSINTANFGAWDVDTTYIPGTIVQYNGNDYVATVVTTGDIPGVSDSWLQTTLPADTTRPNYYDLNPYHIYVVYLFPTFGNVQESDLAIKCKTI